MSMTLYSDITYLLNLGNLFLNLLLANIKVKVASILILTAVLLLSACIKLLPIQVSATPPVVGKLHHHKLLVGDLSRELDYYLPNDLQKKPSLIFALHGSMSTGKDMRKQTAYQFDYLAEQENIIVVYPYGYKKHWNDCRASASYAANKKNIDDLAFFKLMITYFQEHYDVDASKVFATGISNGGHMIYRLGMEMPNDFLALAAMAANLPVDKNLGCTKSNVPISIAIFNGTDDPVNPYEGGLVNILGNKSRGSVYSSKGTAEYWSNLFISGAQSTSDYKEVNLKESDGDLKTSITLRIWKSLHGDQVRLYSLQGSGHVVPSKLVSFPFFVGGNAGDIEAADEIWNFFSEIASGNN